MGLHDCIPSSQNINNSWFEIIVLGLLENAWGFLEQERMSNENVTKNPAYDKCSGVVHG